MEVDMHDEWLDVTFPEHHDVRELSMSAVTEPTTASSISNGGCDDDATARNILDAPLQTYAHAHTVAVSAASAASASIVKISQSMTRNLTRGMKCASSMRRRMRTSKLRVPTYVTSACTRAAVGHVVSTMMTPVTSVPWRIAMAVADNHYVAVGACAATLLAATVVLWPRCVNTGAGART